MTTIRETQEHQAELDRLAAAIAEAAALGLVAMQDQSREVVNVAPGSVEDHERLGFKVIE